VGKKVSRRKKKDWGHALEKKGDAHLQYPFFQPDRKKEKMAKKRRGRCSASHFYLGEKKGSRTDRREKGQRGKSRKSTTGSVRKEKKESLCDGLP